MANGWSRTAVIPNQLKNMQTFDMTKVYPVPVNVVEEIYDDPDPYEYDDTWEDQEDDHFDPWE